MRSNSPGLPGNFPAIAVREPLMIVCVTGVGGLGAAVVTCLSEVIFTKRVVGFIVVTLVVFAVVVGRGGAFAGSGHSTPGINL